MQAQYDLAGELIHLGYPDSTVNFTFDTAGRMLSAIDKINAINYATSASYSPGGAITGLVSGAWTDKFLLPVEYLKVGEGILRDYNPDSEWRPWHKCDDATGS